jgi:transcriptional regulator GlxA family with amidase domain
MKAHRPIRLAFLLLPQFSMMAFSAALEPLRAANRLAGRQLYEWRLVSNDGHAVTASNGIAIAVNDSRESLAQPDLLVACVGMEPLDASANASLRGWLRRLAGHGCQVGGISGGAFLLAEAGLLDGKRCTVHWEFAELFASRYPRARLVPDLFVAEEGVFTCSGGTAALDLMLHFIREHCGAEKELQFAADAVVAEQDLEAALARQGARRREEHKGDAAVCVTTAVSLGADVIRDRKSRCDGSDLLCNTSGIHEFAENFRPWGTHERLGNLKPRYLSDDAVANYGRSIGSTTQTGRLVADDCRRHLGIGCCLH